MVPVGKTKNVGFQFGLRKTFDIPQDKMWEFMFSDKGLNIWLGNIATDLARKRHFKTDQGIEGQVRVFVPQSHIRLNWKKGYWSNMSTLQVRILGDQQKTTISFHQEKLLDSQQREEARSYWTAVMDRIVTDLAKD